MLEFVSILVMNSPHDVRFEFQGVLSIVSGGFLFELVELSIVHVECPLVSFSITLNEAVLGQTTPSSHISIGKVSGGIFVDAIVLDWRCGPW